MFGNKLYVGSYTDPETGNGIYVYHLDPESGKLDEVTEVKDPERPGFLAFSPDRTRLYACRETPDYAGLSAYSVSEDGAKIELINRIDLPGSGCCHLSVSKDGRFVVCANFFSGSVFSVALDENGALDHIASMRSHFGEGPVKDWWQTAARCHQAQFSPDYSEVVVGDLGADQAVVYRFNPDSGDLQDQVTLKACPGDGPRHCAYSPDGKRIFMACEISGYLNVFELSEDRRSAAMVERVSLLPENYDGPQNTVGEIYITKDGRFVFASNRGHETICRYTIGPDGKLSDQTFFSVDGKHPRMFNFDPEEKYCLIANLETNEILIKRFNKETGEIGEITDRRTIHEPSFMCVIQ